MEKRPRLLHLIGRLSPRIALKEETPSRTSDSQSLKFVQRVESKIVDTTTGFAACDFTQSIGAELLVVPAPEHVECAVPSMMDWALQVTPCSLWIVRET